MTAGYEMHSQSKGHSILYVDIIVVKAYIKCCHLLPLLIQTKTPGINRREITS